MAICRNQEPVRSPWTRNIHGHPQKFSQTFVSKLSDSMSCWSSIFAMWSQGQFLWLCLWLLCQRWDSSAPEIVKTPWFASNSFLCIFRAFFVVWSFVFMFAHIIASISCLCRWLVFDVICVAFFCQIHTFDSSSLSNISLLLRFHRHWDVSSCLTKKRCQFINGDKNLALKREFASTELWQWKDGVQLQWKVTIAFFVCWWSHVHFSSKVCCFCLVFCVLWSFCKLNTKRQLQLQNVADRQSHVIFAGLQWILLFEGSLRRQFWTQKLFTACLLLASSNNLIFPNCFASILDIVLLTSFWFAMLAIANQFGINRHSTGPECHTTWRCPAWEGSGQFARISKHAKQMSGRGCHSRQKATTSSKTKHLRPSHHNHTGR